MSDSTRKRTPSSKRSGDIPVATNPAAGRQESRPSKSAEGGRLFGLPIWWVMSGLFHAIVLGWLIFFSPIRVINLQSSRAEYTAGTAKIQEVMDQVRVVQAERFVDDVRTLQEIQEELAQLQAQKEAEFQKFSAEFATNAPSLAEQSQADAAQAQAEALAAQKDAAAGLTKARQSQQQDDFKSAGPTQKKALDAQGRAGATMERALQALTMSDGTFASARLAQADANELQRRSEKAQLESNDVREDAQWKRSHAQSKQRDTEKAQESLAKNQTEVATAQTNLANARAEAAQLKTDAEAAQTAVADAKAAAEKAKEAAALAKADYDKLDAKDPNKKAAKETSTEAQKAARAATELANSAQRKAERAVESVKNAENRVVQQMARVEQARTEADKARTEADTAEARMSETQTNAIVLQTAAMQAQSKARQTLAVVASSYTPSAMDTNAFEPKPVTNIQANVFRMDLADLYDTAVATETQLTETYKKIRATELAMLRQIPLQRAMELTDVAKTVRPNLKAALQTKPASGEEVPALREAVQSAGSEINAMVVVGTSMLALAKNLGGSGSGDGSSVSLDWIRAKTAQNDAMEGLAAEDAAARAKDLTGAMNGQGAGQAGQGSAHPPGGGGGQAKPGGGHGLGGPPPFPEKFKAVPGRKIKADASGGGWMYVDSWYIIGPFDNARRENLEKKFPPETVVDLNAAYTGKDNQPVRWEFYQSGQSRVTPLFQHFHPERKRARWTDDYTARGLEYIIYYAYTELYFEQATDIWIAVGSDDFSKVWIEDQLVWASGKQQKSWRADEGLRKVHFKQGINRVLYRIENGWHGTDFSLVLCLK